MLVFKRQQHKAQDSLIILKDTKKHFDETESSDEVNEDNINLGSLELSGSSDYHEKRVLPSKPQPRVKSTKTFLSSGTSTLNVVKNNVKNFKLPTFKKRQEIEVIRSDEVVRSKDRRPSGLFLRHSTKRNQSVFGTRRKSRDRASFASVRQGSMFSRFSFKRGRENSFVSPDDGSVKRIAFDNESHRKSKSFKSIRDDASYLNEDL